MKLLCVSDMHGSVPSKLKEIVDKEKPSAILCSGDSMPHTWGGSEESIEALIETGLPVYYCSGNVDDVMLLAMMDELVDSFHLIDGKAIDLEGFRIIGMGPFMGHVSEEELENLVGDSKNLIFLYHRPPEGILDAEENWWGSDDVRSYRNAIEKYKPALALCGHIHEQAGEERIGDTIVLNSATKMNIVEIGDETKVKLIEELPDDYV